ncbi:STAS domain-containing protein [Mycolicibacterium flavescens]|uniref:Anti-anti-sigma factor n=1 Tax=Mycolicibacterium flavescens TaxID=1776 RepID=A0A1E3RRR8_MYCFV|nr:STAS domain-containing protein [Mycolicibacterium flavescens]MCV7279951.1 STAS domain-containing protein [Mycolicibacterium flavescens]ODQ92559.1 anti-anti-sigma factor [Mycolicibacterium flavescens]
MATSVEVHTGRADDGTLLLRVAGELDLSNVEAFTEAIAAARDSDAVVVDFSGIEYLDSGAINALFEHAGRIRRIVANPILMPVLTVSGLTQVADVQAAHGD